MAEAIAQENAETTARRHNAADLWNKLWESEGDDTWRAQALARVYARVVRIADSIAPLGPHGISAVDVGGGRGILAEQIRDGCSLIRQQCLMNESDDRELDTLCVVDHSEAALRAADEKGLLTACVDLEDPDQDGFIPDVDLYVSTECMEHLSEATRHRLFKLFARGGAGALISVPNNRLGPGDGPGQEPQHTVMYNAMSLKRDLLQHFEHVRIEVMGPFLLAVCGKIAEKKFTLSATLPVRDEGHDLEGTLASIRGIADQLVVGIDPRTTDNTWEIAELYADEVFFLERPMGPPDGHTEKDCEVCANVGRCPVCLTDNCDCIYPGDGVDCKQFMGKNGINFAWARNQCIAKCTGEWIFMTEGHERLVQGEDFLLSLDSVMPSAARIGFVLRQGEGQQWSFPWLFQNADDILFTRPVHNVLDYPPKTFCVQLPQIRTLHDRHHERGESRAKQRKAQNRSALLDDWLTRKSEASLFYLSQEYRQIEPDKAIERLEQFLEVSNNGVQRYQARLVLAKEYACSGRLKDAFRVLHGCTADDWCRSEHFVWLGDISTMQGDHEKAHTFYTYAATSIGQAPFTVWWISMEYYGHLPAQRLAQSCGELGRIDEALMWCRKVVELLPPDAPDESFVEAEANVTLLEDAVAQRTEAIQ